MALWKYDTRNNVLYRRHFFLFFPDWQRVGSEMVREDSERVVEILEQKYYAANGEPCSRWKAKFKVVPSDVWAMRVCVKKSLFLWDEVTVLDDPERLKACLQGYSNPFIYLRGKERLT